MGLKLGYIYAGKVLGNLAPGGTDPYTNLPSTHELLSDLGKDGAITETVCTLKVRVDKGSNWWPDDHASTIDGDCFGIWVLYQIGETPTGESGLLRLEPNTKGITVYSAINIPVGGVPQGDLSYLFNLNPSTNVAAWDGGAGCSTEAGYLKIKLGAEDRYVQLYKTSP